MRNNGFSTESLTEMTFQQRNECLADAWSKRLKAEERANYNSRAKTEKILSTREQIKRILKRISNEVIKMNLFIRTVRYYAKGKDCRE